MGNSYYKDLNISENATENEIDDAYNNIMNKIKPYIDKSGGATYFKERLDLAYDVLSNKTSKEEYDFFNSCESPFNENFNKIIVDTTKYNTNIDTLTCTCKDFLIDRKLYSINDPRRLCKHLIASFEDDHTYDNYMNDNRVIVPECFIPFGNTISDCKIHGIGFKKYKKIILYKDFIIATNGNNKYIDVWSNNFINEQKNTDYIKYTKNYIDRYWYKSQFKNDRFHNIEGKDVFFESGWYGGDGSWGISSIPNILACYTISKRLDISLNNFNVFNFKKNKENLANDELLKIYGEKGDLKRLLNEIDIIKYFGHKILFLDKIYESILFSNDKNDNKVKKLNQILDQKVNSLIDNNLSFEKFESILEQEDIKFKEESKKEYEYLQNLAKEKGYILSPDYDDVKIEYDDELTMRIAYIIYKGKLSEYSETKDILKKYNIKTITFNKTLQKMNLITKDKSLNENNWILIKDSLNYGINYSKHSYYSHSSIPDWYKMHYYDFVKEKFCINNSMNELYMTKILWDDNKFDELYQKVENFINNEAILNQQKKEEKNTAINNLNPPCPNCNHIVTHKKDKRKRKDYDVQRYQCSECKKTFQQKIELI